MLRQLRRVSALALLVPLSFFIVMCGGDGNGNGDGGAAQGPEAEAQQAVRNIVDAYNRGDINGFLEGWTNDGLQQSFGLSRQQVTTTAEQFFGGPPRQIREIEKTSVRGGSAFMEVEYEVGRSVYRESYIMVPEAGTWKINAAEKVKPDLRRGADWVEVEMTEFAFDFDRDDVEGGNIGFEALNSGSQEHELSLLRVSADFDVQQAMASLGADLPPGVEVLGATGPIRSGKKGWLALVEQLPAGRYLMACFLPDTADPQNTPHAAKGMLSEFNVTAEGGGR
jgi:hypothetical protein